MKTINLTKTILKLNVSKKLKIKGIIIGYIEYFLTGYKLIFIIPTMLLHGIIKLLYKVWDWLDCFCYNLPDIQLLSKEDKSELIKAIKERKKTVYK